MGEFTKIERSFWETDEAREMTPEEKYFWLYLRTNANVNTLGCYPFRIRRAMDETGYNRESLEKLLARMVESGYICYSTETGEVWLLGWGAENWTKKTSILRALRSDLQNVKSKDFKAELSALLQEGGFLTDISKASDSEATDDAAADSTDCNCGFAITREEHSETAGNNGEQPGTNGTEKEKEKEKEKKKKTFSGKSAEFAAFWSAYPNKKNKQTAAKAWDKLKVTLEIYAAIMAGLECAKASAEWAKDGGAYIPHPATWLNAGGWENEYKPLREARAPQWEAGVPPEPPTPPHTPFMAVCGGCAAGQSPATYDDALERRRRLAEGGD